MILRSWPYPTMYQFLLDEFHRHLANADKAKAESHHAKYLDELGKAYTALSDFKVLLDEFKSYQGR